MRLRQLVLACGFSTFALSQFASALGLGEVTLKSALNQPLEAEIKLLDTGDLTADQILISLASPADFERNGIDRLYFYSELQFEVELNAAGGPKVIVTSRDPVREPYLNFLVEARWTAGRLLREYTLLMDLPTFSEDSSRAVVSSPAGQQAARPSSSTSYQSESPRRAESVSAPSTSRSKAAEISGDQYQVRANDTLWEIAEGVRGSSGASVHQAMMALYEANPDAFINGNINLLRRGQVLRIPAGDEMKSLSRSDAVRQFAQHTQDSGLGAQLNASRRTDSGRTSSGGVSGRVKLAAPSSNGSGGQGSGANQGSGSGLESELASTLEELDKSKAENTELTSRVKDLEAQIKTMEQLVEVSNEKMRALQLAAQQQAQASSNTVSSLAESSASESSAPAIAMPPAAETSSAQAVSSIASSSVASMAVASRPAVQPKKVAPPPPPQPGLTDVALENAPWIGLGLLVLGAGGYLVYRRRKDQAEAEVDDTFEQNPFEMDAELEEEQHEPELDADLNLDEEVTPELDEEPVEAETGDVVAEAEIYIAYGQLDKAEELLQNGLKKDPNSADIRLKLLEVYSHKQDLAAFDKHYGLLAPVAGAAILTRAAELRGAIPGAEASEFAAPEAAAAPAEDFNFADLDLSDDSDLAEAPEVKSAGSLDLADSDLDFDLDLGDDFDVKATPGVEDSFSLDDDLSLDDEGLSLEDDSLSLDDDLSLEESPLADADMEDLDFASHGALNDLDDLDLSLGDDEQPTPLEADDLSELSLALDELDKPELAEDVGAGSNAIEDEFSFELDDESVASELDVEDFESPLEEEQEAKFEPQSESLDVAADDFNLDMDVGDVDLAALDHEMESLDELDVGESSLDAPLELSDEDELSGLTAELESDELASLDFDQLPDSGLSLTDELDEADLNEADLGEPLDLEGALEAPETSDEALHLEDEIVEEDLQSPELEVSGLAAEDLEIEPEALADDDVFAEALSDFSGEDTDLDLEKLAEQNLDMSDEDMDSELDFLADADEAATKLDLARAYIDMGDAEGARDILSEVVQEGNEQQRTEAEELLSRIQA